MGRRGRRRATVAYTALVAAGFAIHCADVYDALDILLAVERDTPGGLQRERRKVARGYLRRGVVRATIKALFLLTGINALVDPPPYPARTLDAIGIVGAVALLDLQSFFEFRDRRRDLRAYVRARRTGGT
jgi:hypothetical protein